MSDSIYKWAARELDAIKLNGQPIDFQHAVALQHVLSSRIAEVVYNRRPIQGEYGLEYPKIGTMDWNRESMERSDFRALYGEDDD